MMQKEWKEHKILPNLENWHHENRVISQLKIKEDKFVTTNKEILNQCQIFNKIPINPILTDRNWTTYSAISLKTNFNTLIEDKKENWKLKAYQPKRNF